MKNYSDNASNQLNTMELTKNLGISGADKLCFDKDDFMKVCQAYII